MMHLDALPNRKENEQTVYVLRRHWIVPAKIVVTTLLAAAIPLAIYYLILTDFPDLLAHEIFTPLLALFACFFYLAVAMFGMQEIVDYYLDTWIVTTERVLDISQHGLFKRVSSELHLDDIVDVTSEVKGVVPTFLNYGDVIIQTAGEIVRFHFQQIPHPDEVRQMVLKLVDEDRNRHHSEAKV